MPNTVLIDITEINKLLIKFFLNLDFNDEEAQYITKNLLAAELAGKRTHGLVRLKDYQRLSKQNLIPRKSKELRVQKESEDSLFFDADGQSGSPAVYRSLQSAYRKLKKQVSKQILIVGIRNMSYATGFIGDYAREAAAEGFIFLSFFNSPPALIPEGSIEAQWGTNPISYSFPDSPLLYDSASTIISWGELMRKRAEDSKIDSGLALNAQGQDTTSPAEAMQGGLLSMGGHKGSGLGLLVEIMAGVLTGSGFGRVAKGGWGGCYILIRPEIFIENTEQIKQGISALLNDLNTSQKRSGVKHIYFPGEKSRDARLSALSRGKIEISQADFRLLRNL